MGNLYNEILERQFVNDRFQESEIWNALIQVNIENFKGKS